MNDNRERGKQIRQYLQSGGAKRLASDVLYHNIETAYSNKPEIDDSGILSEEYVDSQPQHSFGDRVRNMAVHWLNQINDMASQDTQWKIQQTTWEKEDLDKINQLKQLTQRRAELSRQLADNNANVDLDSIVTELNKLDQDIIDLHSHFLTTGRQSDVVADLLYDKDSVNKLSLAWDYITDNGENLKSLGRVGGLIGNRDLFKIGKDVLKNDLPKGSSFKENLANYVGNIARVAEDYSRDIGNIISMPIRQLAAYGTAAGLDKTWLVEKSNQLYKSLTDGTDNAFDTRDDIYKKVLRSSDDQEFLKNLYKGFNEQSVLTLDKDQLDKRSKDIDDRIKNLTTEFEAREEASKLGRVYLVHPKLRTNLYYNTKVDDWWLKEEEEEFGNDITSLFTMPDHTIASTASTVSFLSYQVPQMGLEAATSFLAKKYGADAILGASSGGVGTIAKRVGLGALKAATVAMGVASTVEARKGETGIEALTAYQNRIIENASKNGADFQVVNDAIDQDLIKRGYDPKNIDEDKKLKYGIMFGTRTGDEVWDSSLDQSRAGLTKLINQNNALAAADYLEMLPYMNYTGGVINKALKKEVFRNTVNKSRRAAGKSLPNREAIDRLFNYASTQNKMSQSLLEPGGFIRYQIDNAAKRMIKKDMPKMGLMFRDIASYSANRLPLAIMSSLKEGIEEGQQELLQSRYSRGEYDNYSAPVTMFDVADMLSALHLAGGAIADYLGVGIGDVDNASQDVRKAMNVGFASSLVFSNARHMMTNIMPESNVSNLRSLIKDLSTSNTITRLVADNYEKALDYDHASIFYESMKRGKNPEALKDRLQLLFDGEYKVGGDAVTKDMIDADKMLIDNVYYMMNNPNISNIAKEQGWKKYSDQYKQIVLDGATKITDVAKTQELRVQLLNDIINTEKHLRDRFLEYIDPNISEEERSTIEEEIPGIKKLAENFDKLHGISTAHKRSENATKVSRVKDIIKNARKLTYSTDQEIKQALTNVGVSNDKLDLALERIHSLDDIDQVVEDIVDPEEGITSRQTAVSNLLQRFLVLNHMRVLRNALKLSRDSEQLLKYVQQVTGLDINTNNLKGIVNELENIEKTNIDKWKNKGVNIDDEQEIINLEGYDWQLDDEFFNAYNKDLLSFFINGGLLGPQRTAAQPYHFGQVSPTRARNARYGLNVENTYFDDMIATEESYAAREKASVISRLNKGDRDTISLAIDKYISLKNPATREETKLVIKNLGLLDHLAEDILDYIDLGGTIEDATLTVENQKKAKDKQLKNNKKAAVAEIKKNLEEAEKRSRIARREFVEDQSDAAGMDLDRELVQDIVDGVSSNPNDVQVPEANKRVKNANVQISAGEKSLGIEGNAETEKQQKLKKELEEKRAAAEAEHRAKVESKSLDNVELEYDDEEDTSFDISEVEEESEDIPEHLLGPKDVSDTFDKAEDNPPVTEDEERVIIEPETEVTETHSDEEYAGVVKAPLNESEDIDPNEKDIEDRDEEIKELNKLEELILIQFEEDDRSQEEIDQESDTEERAISNEIEETAAVQKSIGYVKIDNLVDLEIDENGNVSYNGQILNSDLAEYIKTQLTLLGKIENGSIDQNDLPMGNVDEAEYKKYVTREYVGNLLANTFFYAIDDEQKNKSLADEGTTDTFNGVKLPKEIGTAAELSKKLSTKGWLYNASKYYIVTKSKRVDSAVNKKDALTVSLIIEDDEKCYITSLRDLGVGQYTENGKKHKFNNDLYWRNWLFTKNINKSLIEQELGHPLSDDIETQEEQISEFLAKRKKEVAKYEFVNVMLLPERLFESWYSGDLVKNNKAAQKSHNAALAKIHEIVLKAYALYGSAIIDQPQALAQIDKLRALRNTIIDQYCVIQGDNIIVPTTVRTDVVPNTVEQSNGKINNKKDKHKNPVFSLISDKGSVEEILEQIDNGEIVLGLGKGAAAEDRFAIVPLLDRQTSGNFKGKGLSGKIYMFVKGLIEGRFNRIPIILSEQKFNSQITENKGNRYIEHSIVPCLELTNDNVIENTSAQDLYGTTRFPSAAEVLFYMITRRGQFRDVTDEALKLFINVGQETLLKLDGSYWQSRSIQDRGLFSVLASKLLSWDTINGKNVLTIGMLDPDSRGYSARQFTEEELFSNTDESAQIRTQVIRAIARLMHWNTDKDLMNRQINLGNINDLVGTFLKYCLDTFGKPLREFDGNVDQYLNQEVEILGCPQLSFKVGDFYEKIENAKTNGDQVKPKSVSVVSWMLKTGRLMHDLDDPIFINPYVFADGVKGVSLSSNQSTDEGLSIPKPAEKRDAASKNPFFNKIDNAVSTGIVLPGNYYSLFVANSDQERSNMQDKQGFIDRILFDSLDLPDDIEYSVNSAMNVVENAIKQFIETYNKTYKDYNFTLDDVVYVPKRDSFKKRLEDQNYLFKHGDFNPLFKLVAEVKYNQKREKNVIVIKVLSSNEGVSDSNEFTGIYSKINKKKRRKGKSDAEAARKWLFDTLGIEGYNVIVQNAAINGANGTQAYGATTLAIDSITKRIVGKIGISLQEGSAGVEFHEAWHYVNLLLHNKAQRDLIYAEYVKTHPELKNASYQEIEEEMAEDFLDYVLAKQDNSLLGKVKRFFRNALDFINLVLNRKQYRLIYDNILKGGYKFKPLNDKSVKEFQDLYGSEFYKIAGLQENLDNGQFKNIRTYQELYEAIDSSINNVFVRSNLTSEENIRKFARLDGVGTIVQDIQNRINAIYDQYVEEDEDIDDVELDKSDQHTVDVLNDLLNNKEVIQAELIARFDNLGFKTKVKKRKHENNESIKELPTDIEVKEDNPDNTWDRLELTMSKKDNAAARVKMFLAIIPKYNTIFTKNGGIIFTPQKDKFGGSKLWDFNEVWNVVAKVLSESNSYEDLKRRIDERAKENALFNSIKMKLDELDKMPTKLKDSAKNILFNAELKSQLYGVFNSHKNSIQTINLSEPFEAPMSYEDTMMMDEFEQSSSFKFSVGDVNKNWATSDDGMYNPAFTLPRRWSQFLVANGAAVYKDGDLVISDKFVNNPKTGVAVMYDKLVDEVERLYNKLDRINRSEDRIREASNNFTAIAVKLRNLYNVLGIPVDSEVLLNFIPRIVNITDSHPDGLSKEEQLFRGLRLIIVGSKGAGTLHNIIETLKDNVDKSEISANRKNKAVDELFTGFTVDSHISKLALAYSDVYPQLKEISTKSANGDTLYPISLNNFISDKTNAANAGKAKWAELINASAYSRGSIIADVAQYVQDDNEETKLRLNTFVGLRDQGSYNGGDYFEITPLEDYLAKLFLTENDNLIFPTMADKKTWYSLSVGTSSRAIKLKIGAKDSGFHLTHDVIISRVDNSIINKAAAEYYQSLVEEYNPEKHGDAYNFRVKFVRPWYNELDSVEGGKELKAEINSRAEDILSQGKFGYRRFSNNTLTRFYRYLLSEIDTLLEYYDPENVRKLVANPNQLIANYHAGIENGKMKFGGNGGMFRYFYNVDLSELSPNIATFIKSSKPDTVVKANLNQTLQLLYDLQAKVQEGGVKNINADETDAIQSIPISVINSENPTGFEFIVEYLLNLRKNVIDNQDAVYSSINSWLMNRVEDEIDQLSNENSPIRLIKKYENGTLKPISIPAQFLNNYINLLKAEGFADGNPVYGNSDESVNYGNTHAIYSLIGSHVANTLTSIIEIEKIYSGDPAFYKYKYLEENRKRVKQTVQYSYSFGEGYEVQGESLVDVLVDNFSDKIKRLGGTLSPGTELRLDYTEQEINADIDINNDFYKDEALTNAHALLGTSKYTVLDIEDIECPSEVLNSIEENFKKQALIDLIRNGDIEVEDKLQVIDDIYFKDGVYDKYFNMFKDVQVNGIKVSDIVEINAKQLAKPYNNINVADAQVFIRPAMYRKIRMSIGDWSKEDEEAYWIIEKDDTWLHDENKAKKVARFQLYALKMSYFSNDLTANGNIQLNVPIYNKMAIFPLFKFLRSTDTGRMLYDRMNKVGNELDMIAFTSAVKVGATKNAAQLISDEADVHNATSRLSDLLNNDSDLSLNYRSGEVLSKLHEGTLAVKIQDLHNLRLQLNTHAHEDDFRNIGTQMFKIAFSNVVDEEYYGNKKGRELKDDIMSCIKALTKMGVDDIHKEFFNLDESTGEYVPNEESINTKMLSIIESNGLGEIAQTIIEEGGRVSSLPSRSVFEQSVSKMVNSEVVDIETPGGTAIQQSVFGFEQYSNVDSYENNDTYVKYNGGKNLEWHKENGSMEVILSIKFFKSVVPKEYQKDYSMMRQWLIDNDVIKGTKTDGTESNPNPFGIGYRIPTQGMSSMFAFTVADVLPQLVGDLIVVPREFTAQTGSDK